jgi:PAS domain S-box-containing protein
MEYLYYDSQYKEIQATLNRLKDVIAGLPVPNREAITEAADHLSSAVQELLSTFIDLPTIPTTASPPPNGQNALPPRLRNDVPAASPPRPAASKDGSPSPPRDAWASTLQLEAILNNMIAGVVVCDAQGIIKFANSYAIALFGFDPTRMQRDSLARKLQVYGEDGKRVLVQQMPSSIAAGGEVVMNRPLTIHSSLGRAAHVLCSAMPVTAAGRLTGVVSVWNDVSGQHNLLKENQQQRELLEAIFNAISDSVMVYDADGKPIRRNLATLRTLGFDPLHNNRSEIALRLSISHPDGTPIEIDELTSSLALTGENVRDAPYRITNFNGQTRAVLSSGAPLRNEQGEITGAVTIWHDVTELEQVRKQVEAERDRLKTILKSMDDEVWYCDPAGIITLMNEVVVPSLGISDAGQLNGLLAESVNDRLQFMNTDGTLRPADKTPLMQSLKGETIRGEEIVRNMRTGERKHREYITSPIRSRDDQITGAVAVVRDITAQKKQEAALRASIANEQVRLTELNAIMDAVPVIIFLTHDPHARKVTGNRVAYEFLRVPSAGNLSKSAPEEEAQRNFRVFRNGREPLPEELPLQVAAATGKPVRDVEEDVLFDDGSRAHLIGNVSPLLDEAGQPAGAVAAFLDITERVENSTQMEVQRRLLEHREMERQKIARDLHDGPIQGLGGLGFSLQILQDLSTDPEIKGIIAQMQADVKAQVRDLREVINELRPPALAHFGLRKAIRSYGEVFQARHPGLEVHLELAEDDVSLPDSALLALYRIFQESLYNIEHHAQAGRVTVRLATGPQDITLEIEDNGVGFQPTSDWVELTRQGHFGLVGMKERAEAIGGRFTVSSEPENGTKIRVVAPWE